MLGHSTVWLMLVTMMVTSPATAVANAVLPGLSYLPPRPDNTLLGADTCTKTCSFNYEPMCGNDGITYTNECTFSVAACKNTNLMIERVGSCASGRPSGRPSIPSVPDLSGLPPPPPSPPTPRPPPVVIPFPEDIPGFQPPTESGVIPFPPSFESLDTANPLPPPSVTSTGCPEACTKIYIPLCGTDGVTYNNKCLLDVAACKGRNDGLNIDAAFEGTCESVDVRESSSCNKKCTKIFHPVCGSDDKNYNNPCLLEIASCKSVSSGGDPVTISHDGHCVPRDTALFVAVMSPRPVSASSVESSTILTSDDAFGNQGGTASLSSSQSSCPEACTKIFTPVCGSDDITYNNECLLNVAACKGRSAGGDVLFKAFDGPCVAALPRGPVCDHACDKTFLPVCGTDGETYNNICLLNLADCLTPFTTISQASDGPCPSTSAGNQRPDRRPSISVTPPQTPTSNFGTVTEREYLPPV